MYNSTNNANNVGIVNSILHVRDGARLLNNINGTILFFLIGTKDADADDYIYFKSRIQQVWQDC